jgi:hypothetical protein
MTYANPRFAEPLVGAYCHGGPPRQEGFATTTPCYPDVPLPAGVTAAGGWQPNDALPYRVVLGEDRGVTNHNVVVHTIAIQFADGRIADGRIKAATVYSGRGLSSTQARELAAALLEAADDLDRWAGTEPPCPGSVR